MGWIYCGCKVTPTEELHWLVCSVEPCQYAFIHTHMHNHAILSKWLPLTVVVSVCACVSKSLCGCLSVWIIFLSVLVNAKMVKALMFLCDTEMFAGYLFYSDLTCCPMSDSSKKKKITDYPHFEYQYIVTGICIVQQKKNVLAFRFRPVLFHCYWLMNYSTASTVPLIVLSASACSMLRLPLLFFSLFFKCSRLISPLLASLDRRVVTV